MKLTRYLVVALLLMTPVAPSTIAAERHGHLLMPTRSDRYWRTELYFGLGRNNGPPVTDEEWQRFLTDEVTPRFPEGMTIIEARGQYRNASGVIIREPSRMLILLYPRKHRTDAGKKIDAICSAYKRIFQQESVLRVTASTSSTVTF